MSHTVDVGFEVHAANPQAGDAVRAALAFSGHDSLLVKSGADVRLTAILDDSPPRPERIPDFSLADGIDAFVDDHSVRYYSQECFASVDIDSPSITVSIPDGGYPRPDLLIYAIVPVLARFGYYALHAGAVSDGSRGYLFMADSGGGKSTATLIAAQAGWAITSDDFVYLHREEHVDLVVGLRGVIRLRPDAQAHFPALVSGEPELRSTHKYRISISEAFPGRFRSSCVPEVIVIPEVTGDTKSRLEEVSRSDVLAEAMRQSGPFLVDRRTVPKQMSRLRDLIQHCTCCRLRAGSDILARPDILTTLLAGAAS